MSEWIFDSDSVQATQLFAAKLVKVLEPGSVVALVGDLGLGKTHFVQGVAQGLDVPASVEVVSPTYGLVHEYPGGERVLVHMDFYRLNDSESAYAMGVEDQIYRRDGVVVIEWADRLTELIPDDAVWIHFEWISQNARRLMVKGLEEPDF